MESNFEIQMLITSMINSAYELNTILPNIEMIFYRIFNSPISSLE